MVVGVDPVGHEVDGEVDMAEMDGGWSVTVDGHHATTVTVDGLYVGVRVPPGQHVVVFSYWPPGFRAGQPSRGPLLPWRGGPRGLVDAL